MAKKRNKAYKSKNRLANSVEWAIAGSHKFPDSVVEKLLDPVIRGLTSVYHGEADRDDWNVVFLAMKVSQRLAKTGIGPNLLPDIDAALTCLVAVAKRMAAGSASTCAPEEVERISEGVEMCNVQLRLCTQAEYSRANRWVQARLRSGGEAKVAEIYHQMPVSSETEPDSKETSQSGVQG